MVIRTPENKTLFKVAILQEIADAKEGITGKILASRLKSDDRRFRCLGLQSELEALCATGLIERHDHTPEGGHKKPYFITKAGTDYLTRMSIDGEENSPEIRLAARIQRKTVKFLKTHHISLSEPLVKELGKEVVMALRDEREEREL